jgi:tetratricopeptide (TPR) repeat protein
MAVRSVLVVCLLAVLAPMIAAPEARAQAPTRELAQRALDHYQRGVSAYRGGDYEVAIQAFNDAYEVDPAPILVFNIAQAHWKLSHREPALAAYRRYLSLEPGATNRAQVEGRIAELTAAPAAPGRVEPEPLSSPEPRPPGVVEPVLPPSLVVPVAPAPPAVLSASQPAPRGERRPPFYRRGLFWSVVGALAVGTAVAVAVAARPGGGSHWSCADCNWSGARVP